MMYTLISMNVTRFIIIYHFIQNYPNNATLFRAPMMTAATSSTNYKHRSPNHIITGISSFFGFRLEIWVHFN